MSDRWDIEELPFNYDKAIIVLLNYLQNCLQATEELKTNIDQLSTSCWQFW